MQRRLPQVVAFVFGVVMFLQYFSTHPVARGINAAVLVDFWQIIFAFALIVGVVTFVKSTATGISRSADWPYRVVSLAGVIIMPIFAVVCLSPRLLLTTIGSERIAGK